MQLIIFDKSIVCIVYGMIWSLYSQERLIDAQLLNGQVPQIVIQYYEAKLVWGSQKTFHYIIEDAQII